MRNADDARGRYAIFKRFCLLLDTGRLKSRGLQVLLGGVERVGVPFAGVCENRERRNSNLRVLLFAGSVVYLRSECSQMRIRLEIAPCQWEALFAQKLPRTALFEFLCRFQLSQIVIAEAASKIGVKINLKVETQANYYGKATFGNSDWLDATMSLVDYGDRGVPNVFLDAPLLSNGTWNAAHFKNPTYDNLVKQYTAAVDLQSQRQLAGKIQTLLLDETPLIIPYFIDGLTATSPSVTGVNPTSIAAIYLKNASKSA